MKSSGFYLSYTLWLTLCAKQCGFVVGELRKGDWDGGKGFGGVGDFTQNLGDNTQ